MTYKERDERTVQTAKRSLDAVEEQLNVYTEWGYGDCFSKIVEALYECRKVLKEEYKRLAMEFLERY